MSQFAAPKALQASIQKTDFEAAYKAHVEVDKTLCVTAMTLAVQQSMMMYAGGTACGIGGQDNYRRCRCDRGECNG